MKNKQIKNSLGLGLIVSGLVLLVITAAEALVAIVPETWLAFVNVRLVVMLIAAVGLLKWGVSLDKDLGEVVILPPPQPPKQ